MPAPILPNLLWLLLVALGFKLLRIAARERSLPEALTKLRVIDAPAVCERIALALQSAELAAPHLASPEDIFGRIGRR